MLEVGTMAPDFALYNQNGDIVALSRLGDDVAHAIIYFFPQAESPGCTQEACGFREVLPDLRAHNVRVIGISTAPVPTLASFASANRLEFDLCSDPDHRICEEWKAWRGQGVGRMTYVVDGRATITHVFPRVDVYKHGAELAALLASGPAPAAKVEAAQAGAGGGAVVEAAAPPSELAVSLARASLQLLLQQLDAGAALPADVAELAARVAARRG